jgi:hypothetical protein
MDQEQKGESFDSHTRNQKENRVFNQRVWTVDPVGSALVIEKLGVKTPRKLLKGGHRKNQDH